MHVDSKDNLADLLTKPLGKIVFNRLNKKCLFRVPTNFKKEDDIDEEEKDDKVKGVEDGNDKE